ncbi:pseudouridine synthase [Oxalobacteraceae bacterium R-40]|uniref:Dual-specificity RNA pseudouridine synthase RluF n=1 Tax=Keguizhuia sedimenti TaxID=3064264 RepID=A0ABU1BR79_9BURK|nr:pseudouridine synthase [Oxalobacteraceae bacterium R-40]
MTEPLRLSKRMSELGLCSRREADEWIERGWVRVDGVVVSQLGSKVLPNQRITIERQAAQQQARRVTVLLNKPMGYVSGQAEDGYQPAVTLVNAGTRWKEDKTELTFHPSQLRSLVPAGRLDIDSVGLLVLTQDGRIAKQLIGEDSSIEKEYLVRVRYTKPGKLPDADLQLLNHGLSLDGKKLLPAKVRWQNEDQLRFILREGKKRQIRRMCEAVGLKVLGLKRVRIGKVALGDLPPGQWRYLRDDERF